MQVSQVMSRPGGEELAQRYGAERGMAATAIEVNRL